MFRFKMQQEGTVKFIFDIKIASAETTCNRCGKRYKSNQGLREHMSREHGVQRYNCGQYEKGFMSRTLFRSHILMHAQVNMLMLFDAVLMSHNPSMLKHDKVIYFNDIL